MPKKTAQERRRERNTKKVNEPIVLDFTDVPLVNGAPRDRRKLVMTPKQIRARARRTKRMSKEEFEALYKPVEEWDEEELARGRPRDRSGHFRGPPPQWLTREVHEKAMERFKHIIRLEVNELGSVAMGVIRNIMVDEEVDSRGKWRTPASARLQAAQLMLEHIIGKPVQHMEQELSVRMLAVLADATVGPGQAATEENMQKAAQERYERAYGELGSGEVTRPSSEVIDAEVIEDDDGE